jgi:hypothetical protein
MRGQRQRHETRRLRDRARPPTLQAIAETRAASATWDTLVGASWLPVGESVLTDEHWVWNVTTVAPPTAACDTTTL